MVAFILEKHLPGRSALATGKSTDSHEPALFTVAQPPHEPNRCPERLVPSQKERSGHQTGQDAGAIYARKILVSQRIWALPPLAKLSRIGQTTTPP